MNNLLNEPPTRSQWQICAQGVTYPGESKKRRERPGACVYSSMMICSVPVQTALLAGAVGITGSRVVGIVRPFPLDFPPAVIRERD
jgi:hypothetical protein